MLVFFYFLVAAWVFAFLALSSRSELDNPFHLVALIGISVLWPLTIILIIIKWKDLKE